MFHIHFIQIANSFIQFFCAYILCVIRHVRPDVEFSTWVSCWHSKSLDFRTFQVSDLGIKEAQPGSVKLEQITHWQLQTGKKKISKY
jgi:hypothetical protein